MGQALLALLGAGGGAAAGGAAAGGAAAAGAGAGATALGAGTTFSALPVGQGALMGAQGAASAAPAASASAAPNLFSSLRDTARSNAMSIGSDFRQGNFGSALGKIQNFQRSMQVDLLDNLSGGTLTRGLQDRLATQPGGGIPTTMKASQFVLDAAPNQFLQMFDSVAQQTRQRRQQQSQRGTP